jgi:hypothetical protein
MQKGHHRTLVKCPFRGTWILQTRSFIFHIISSPRDEYRFRRQSLLQAGEISCSHWLNLSIIWYDELWGLISASSNSEWEGKESFDEKVYYWEINNREFFGRLWRYSLMSSEESKCSDHEFWSLESFMLDDIKTIFYVKLSSFFELKLHIRMRTKAHFEELFQENTNFEIFKEKNRTYDCVKPSFNNSLNKSYQDLKQSVNHYLW